MKKLQIIGLFVLSYFQLFSIDTDKLSKNEIVKDNQFNQELDNWTLEKNYTILLESKINVQVPLEIISDVEIDTLILDNEEKYIPFEIGVNKSPEKNNYYKLSFSENEIDIDNDGKIDTFIYTPKYINKKTIKDNYVKIVGENISKDGTYNKKVSITIEIDE